jgi:putative peptidoglycan lipid II flippase
MAAGTVVSRITGLARVWVIAATLGLATAAADIFNIPNTIPNALYFLIAGGVLNSVLVPQLVQAMQRDADRGVAYTQRVFTAIGLVLLVAATAATVAAPWLLGLYVNKAWLAPELRPQFDAMVLFARYCIPQIFFYGLYVLLGQILNARGSFGPMMWAPVANNVVVIGIFGAFLLINGTHPQASFTANEVRWLGIGATAGIVVQALILIPVVWHTGLRLRLRLDLKGAGLGRIVRLGFWTMLFVVANQLAYLVVVRLASGATAQVASGQATQAAGQTVYSNAMLLMMVPHSVITVSLATALLPQLSARANEGDKREVATELAYAIRTCLGVIAPIAITLLFAGGPLVSAIFDIGAAAGGTRSTALTLLCFLPGLVAFTVHYLVLRGFYAFQDTRTPFLVQLVLVAVNVVLAVLLVQTMTGSYTAVMLAVAYSVAYVVGAIVSVAVLRHVHLRPLRLDIWSLTGKLVLAGIPTAVVCFALVEAGKRMGVQGNLGQLALAAVVVGVGGLVYLGMAKVVRLREVTNVVTLLARMVSKSRGTPPTEHAAEARHARGGRGTQTVPPSIGRRSDKP